MIDKKKSFLLNVRIVIALTLIILVGLFSTVQLNKPIEKILQKFSGISEVKPNELNAIFIQGRSLKIELPPYGSIHYDTDDPIAERSIILYHAFAPLFLEKNTAHMWWIVRYQTPQFKTQLIKKYQLKQAQELGQSLALLKRKSFQ